MKTITMENLRRLDNKIFEEIAESYIVLPDVLRDSELYDFKESYTLDYVDDIIACISVLLVKNDNLNKLGKSLQKASDDFKSGLVKVGGAAQRDITILKYKLAYLFKCLENAYYSTSSDMMREDLYETMDYPDYWSPEALGEFDREIGVIKMVSQSGKIGLGDMCSDIFEVLEDEYIWFCANGTPDAEHADAYEETWTFLSGEA